MFVMEWMIEFFKPFVKKWMLEKFIWLVIIAVCVVGLYLIIMSIPSRIAYKRQHRNKLAILLLNIFLGWDCCAWIVCLVWALSKSNNNINNISDETDECFSADENIEDDDVS